MLTFIPANAQHIGARAEQQDSFGFSDPANKSFVSHGGFVGIVADGMGGLEGGRQASATAVKVFLDSYSRKQKSEAIPLALRRSLVAANTAVIEASKRMGGDKGAGTTLVAFVLHNTSLYWVSSGDSRLYLLRGGQLARINADHTQRNHLLAEVAAGRLDRDAALNDPQGPHLTSYLGLPEVPIIDLSLRAFPLMKDDVILACSDGIYRGVTEEEMVAAFRQGSPSAACEAIQAMTLAKRNAAQDNLTVIAVECRSEESATLQLPSFRPSRSRRPLLAAVLALEALAAGGLVGKMVWSAQPSPAQKAQEETAKQKHKHQEQEKAKEAAKDKEKSAPVPPAPEPPPPPTQLGTPSELPANGGGRNTQSSTGPHAAEKGSDKDK